MPAPRKPNSFRRGAAQLHPLGQPSSSLADSSEVPPDPPPARKTAKKPPKSQRPTPPVPAISFGPEICTDLATAEQREWLVTNGLGGFASGTIAGSATRRYHGLLFAALNPPAARTQLVAGLDEIVRIDEQFFPLAAHRWLGGSVGPEGYKLLQSFRLEAAIPVWTFQFPNARLEKRVWMQHGENTTFVRYTLLDSPSPIHLELKVLVNYRDFHSTTHAGSPPNEWHMRLEPVENGLGVTAFDGAIPFYLKSSAATCEPQHIWHRDFFFPLERERGLDDYEDQLLAAIFRGQLLPGQSLSLSFSTNPNARQDGDSALQQAHQRQLQIVPPASASSTSFTSLPSLLAAADQFLVSRPLHDHPNAKSIIAGYHWFGDWGRDTMITLPGLTLTTGRPEIAKQILLAFGHYVDCGMLPNNFPDSGSAPPGYNTIDATLWYFEAIRQYFAATHDTATLSQLFTVLEQIIAAHLAGTRYNIHVDPVDGLLYGGGPGIQLTWMDAKIGDWVVTPRTGKPIEINALWLNALDAMSDFAQVLGQSADGYLQHAARARSSFAKFWNPRRNCCFDVLDSPGINQDAALRPNQIFAVSVGSSPLTAMQQKSVVDTCAAQLLTPYGLRSLAPGEPGYSPTYTGGPRERDAAYHQGTIWAWLLGPFALAHYRVYKDRSAALALLAPLSEFISTYGIGTLPELFDADPPHHPRGCIAQAWSVSELLRAHHLLSL
jgi:predicted glycogen debranching enzyme